MNKSYYFAELSSSYDAEMQDLLNDSEGNSALKARLREKRQELAAILPMIEFSPEMVVPVFYDAFSFADLKAMASVVQSEPDDGQFPEWASIAAFVDIQPWAVPYVDAALAESAGDTFMVTAAGLEFIRQFDNAPMPAVEGDESDSEKNVGEDDDDDESRDLGEAGDDWLGEQGFDSFKS